MTRFALFFLFTLAWVACGGETFQVSNSALEVDFDQRTGALTRFRDRASGHDFAGPGAAGLWQLQFEGNARAIQPSDAEAFRFEGLSGRARAARLSWSGFKEPLQDLQVEAIVTVEGKAPATRWHLRLRGLGAQVVRRVVFPKLQNLPRQPGERLAVPMWMGQLSEHPRDLLAGKEGKGTRLEWAYPGLLSMQCLAFYAEGGAGLYAACNDSAGFRKTFAVSGDQAGNVSCEIVHLPEIQGEQWELPYDVLLRSFRGDWFTAAEEYRSWATNQVWSTESRLARGLVPGWVLDTGVWVWNRGRSEQVLDPALALQKRAGLPTSVFWHWWHGCSYDTDFPEYLPPREGAESFKAALARAQQHQVRALVYMNQRLWGMRTASWTNENAERYAVKGPDGTVQPEVYNTFTGAPCASMCMGTEFWRNKYAGLAERAIRELGVNGIYMDQACTSLACYDSDHQHPRGGGTYWVRGFQQMQSDIRQRVLGQSIGLAGEGCGESWLPYLDLMLSLQVSKERYAGLDGWETIPFFHAVYHPFCVTYGNYSSLTMPPYDDLWPAQSAPAEPLKLLDPKFSRQFLLEQARAFVWGQQPTIANFLPTHLQQRPEEVEYVLRLASLRSQALKFLQHGTLMRPPVVEGPSEILDMSRLSIYAGQQGGITEFRKNSVQVMASAWRATDGEIALVLASIAGHPVECGLKLYPRDYGISRQAKVFALENGGLRKVGKLENGRLTLQLPARDARVLVFPGR